VSSSDFESLDRGLLPKVQSLDQRISQSPTSATFEVIDRFDVRERHFKSFHHPLRRPVRNLEFLRDFLKADATPLRCRKTRKPYQILSL
jgi:hypothetical protein